MLGALVCFVKLAKAASSALRGSVHPHGESYKPKH